ncbi:MAG: class II aldolase/adducin family protein [Hormoscilla sp. SP5CHS1]|nr:class II aldolase/adducin family protein [Hormoscilla sp. SP5CHS1]
MLKSLKEIIWEMSNVGQRMSQINATEGAAGNFSVFVRELPDIDSRWRDRGEISLPLPAAALSGGWVIITGTGRREREIAHHPELVICLLHINSDGETASLYAADAEIAPTSELNSHLGVHNDHVTRRSLDHHALIHAQPVHLTYLSHIDRYADTVALNRRLLRWQTETIINFPEGIGVIPFYVPTSPEQAKNTTEGLRNHRAIIWSKHGILTRHDSSLRSAGDLLEYAEVAAQYECLNLRAGEPTLGFSEEQLRQICSYFGINQPFF